MDPTILTQIAVHGGPTAVVAVVGALLIVAVLRLERGKQERLVRGLRAMLRAFRHQQAQTDRHFTLLIERVERVEVAVEDLAGQLRRRPSTHTEHRERT